MILTNTMATLMVMRKHQHVLFSATKPALHTLSHNQLNDNHDHVGDDGHNDHGKEDDPPAPMPSPERRLFYTQSDKHHCFQPNFTVATSIKPLCFRSPANSTVIVFVTQKKRWHLATSQVISALKSTAATNLIIIIMMLMPPNPPTPSKLILIIVPPLKST